jgi:hypothetical protein
MAWGRGKVKADEDPPPAPPRKVVETQMLPVLHEEGTTRDREAYKRLKRADVDLKRLERREARARKREEREARRIDRRIAKEARSRHIEPVLLMAYIVTFTSIASVILMLSTWWPHILLLDPFLDPEIAHEMIILVCFGGAAIAGSWELHKNPSGQYLFKAQFAMGVYFALGLVAAFSGMLLAYVMADMESMDVDWVFWQWVAVLLVAGSGVPMVVVYLVAHRSESRAFLTAGYHKAMGTLNAVCAISLVMLPFTYLPAEGLMYEVGTSMLYIGWLIMFFTVPAMLASLVVRYQGTYIRRAATPY